MGPTPSQASLYERLGGVYAIAAVVDTLIDLIMVDPVRNANPLVDEAHHRVCKAGFKYLVTEQVCMATGGPQRYTGRTMKESHQHLKITPAEWDMFAGRFKAVLDQYKVPAAEQKELFEIVGTTRGDIIVEMTPSSRKPS